MHLTTYGPADGDPTYVLLHGFPGGADDWRGVAGRLAEAGARVLVPDLLGFGASPRPTDFDGLWAAAQADALAAVLDRMGVRDATVVGHDYGGPVAITLTDRRPDLVGALVVADTNAFGDTPITLPLSLVLVPVVGWVAERALFSALSLKVLAGRFSVAPGTRLHVNDGGEATTIRILFAGVLRDLAALYGPIEEVASTITVPTLVVWGAGDPLFPIEQGRRTAELLHARFEVLDGVGHLPPAEAPDALADLLVGWRAEVH
ncbi:MAG: alpha/beta hydrolase [Acidimicrobiales bacterium]